MKFDFAITFSQPSSVGSRSLISPCAGPVMTVGVLSKVSEVCVSESVPWKNTDSRLPAGIGDV